MDPQCGPWFNVLDQPMMIVIWSKNLEDAAKFQYLMQILQVNFEDYTPKWQVFVEDLETVDKEDHPMAESNNYMVRKPQDKLEQVAKNFLLVTLMSLNVGYGFLIEGYQRQPEEVGLNPPALKSLSLKNKLKGIIKLHVRMSGTLAYWNCLLGIDP